MEKRGNPSNIGFSQNEKRIRQFFDRGRPEAAQPSGPPILQQRFVEKPQCPMWLLVRERMIETRPRERIFRLRIGNLPLPSKMGELRLSPLPNRIDQTLIAVTGKVLKRRFLSIFLAHE